jgi:hypothetical protein
MKSLLAALASNIKSEIPTPGPKSNIVIDRDYNSFQCFKAEVSLIESMKELSQEQKTAKYDALRAVYPLKLFVRLRDETDGMPKHVKAQQLHLLNLIDNNYEDLIGLENLYIKHDPTASRSTIYKDLIWHLTGFLKLKWLP